ncbi:AbrB/MazE/SpoVT family DNA-binding domain-containing protein [Candidatus Micrarchaeota archaeon]|nr:AbrB/MazE/SpoVT family DNA-binding domain-containing protein [Candidatus Micrarchaeota archaeon]
MSFISKAVSVGGSIMVTIPKQVAELLNIHPNEPIEIEVKKIKKSGFGLFKGIGKFTKEDELQIND